MGGAPFVKTGTDRQVAGPCARSGELMNYAVIQLSIVVLIWNIHSYLSY